jgi:3D (Asp-Asp-Asp) domain-containing protein
LHLIATAYTAGCEGCSGITKTGTHAVHGVVAVDPRIIPLGTKLYVPGYGRALAGDTGGDIQGHRIDLCFDSTREAQRFGRRAIVVYVVRAGERTVRAPARGERRVRISHA